jgi:hypothetical protein
MWDKVISFLVSVAGITLGLLIWQVVLGPYLKGLFGKKPVYVTEVNLRSCDQSPGLNARKTLGLLYPFFIATFQGKTPEVHELDSFFCDLYSFTRLYEERRYEIYWEVGHYGYTNISTFQVPGAYKITLIPGTSLTVIPPESLDPEDI